MRITRNIPGELFVGSRVVDVVSEQGSTDYILDGEIYRDAPAKAVMVTAESDLDALEGYEPGTVAYVAGFGSMWQLDASGEWQTII